MTVAEKLNQSPEQHPQPEYPAQFINKAIRKVSIPIIDTAVSHLGHRLNATEEMTQVVASVDTSSDLTGLPKTILKENLIAIGDEIHLSANKTKYPDTWWRDTFYTLLGFKLPLVKTALMRRFESHQLPNGQIPTAIARAGDTGWHRSDDETTLLYIIRAYSLWKETSGQFVPQNEVLQRALFYVQKHVHEGMYITPAGTRHGLIDSFDYEVRDVITQNQGLLTLALIAADKLGVNVNKNEINAAKAVYRQLAEPNGFLPLSARHNFAPDASALLPELIALTVFEESLLSDGLVGQTWEHLPRAPYGYKILSLSSKGDSFPSHRFKRPNDSGRYHNGGDFPNVSAMVESVRKQHAIHSNEGIEGKIIQGLSLFDYAEWNAADGTAACGPVHQLWNIPIPMMLGYYGDQR